MAINWVKYYQSKEAAIAKARPSGASWSNALKYGDDYVAQKQKDAKAQYDAYIDEAQTMANPASRMYNRAMAENKARVKNSNEKYDLANTIIDNQKAKESDYVSLIDRAARSAGLDPSKYTASMQGAIKQYDTDRTTGSQVRAGLSVLPGGAVRFGELESSAGGGHVVTRGDKAVQFQKILYEIARDAYGGDYAADVQALADDKNLSDVEKKAAVIQNAVASGLTFNASKLLYRAAYGTTKNTTYDMARSWDQNLYDLTYMAANTVPFMGVGAGAGLAIKGASTAANVARLGLSGAVANAIPSAFEGLSFGDVMKNAAIGGVSYMVSGTAARGIMNALRKRIGDTAARTLMTKMTDRIASSPMWRAVLWNAAFTAGDIAVRSGVQSAEDMAKSLAEGNSYFKSLGITWDNSLVKFYAEHPIQFATQALSDIAFGVLLGDYKQQKQEVAYEKFAASPEGKAMAQNQQAMAIAQDRLDIIREQADAQAENGDVDELATTFDNAATILEDAGADSEAVDTLRGAADMLRADIHQAEVEQGARETYERVKKQKVIPKGVTSLDMISNFIRANIDNYLAAGDIAKIALLKQEIMAKRNITAEQKAQLIADIDARIEAFSKAQTEQENTRINEAETIEGTDETAGKNAPVVPEANEPAPEVTDSRYKDWGDYLGSKSYKAEIIADEKQKVADGSFPADYVNTHNTQSAALGYDITNPVSVPARFIADNIVGGWNGETQRIAERINNPEWNTRQRINDLVESFKKNGYYGDEVLFIGVLPDGTAYIKEGNHRVVAALEAGVYNLPVRIDYYGGGELADSPWRPDRLLANEPAAQYTKRPARAESPAAEEKPKEQPSVAEEPAPVVKKPTTPKKGRAEKPKVAQETAPTGVKREHAPFGKANSPSAMKFSQHVVDRTVAQDGYSIRLDGEVPTDGYMMTAPGTIYAAKMVHPKTKLDPNSTRERFSARSVHDFAEGYRAELESDPDAFIWTWKNNDGDYEISLSMRMPEDIGTLKYAKKHNEFSIYDVRNQRSILTSKPNTEKIWNANKGNAYFDADTSKIIPIEGDFVPTGATQEKKRIAVGDRLAGSATERAAGVAVGEEAGTGNKQTGGGEEPKFKFKKVAIDETLGDRSSYVPSTSSAYVDVSDYGRRFVESMPGVVPDGAPTPKFRQVATPNSSIHDRIQKSFGVPVVSVMSDSDAVNSSYYAFYDSKNNRIVLNGMAPEAASSASLHEISHNMKHTAPDIYNSLVGTIKRLVGESKIFADEIAKYGGGGDAIEEHIGDIIMQVADTEPKFFDRIAAQSKDASVLQKIKDRIDSVFEGVKDAFSLGVSDDGMNYLKRIRRQVIKAMAEYADFSKPIRVREAFSDSVIRNPNTGELLTVYHGTRGGYFDVFITQRVSESYSGDIDRWWADQDLIGVHFGSEQAAIDRMDQFSKTKAEVIGTKEGYANGQRNNWPSEYHVMSFYLDIKNPFTGQFTGRWEDGKPVLIGDHPMSEKDMGRLIKSYADKIANDYHFNEYKNRISNLGSSMPIEVVRLMKSHGYDGFAYSNIFEDVGSTSYIAFDATQIKSSNENTGAYDMTDPRFRFKKKSDEDKMADLLDKNRKLDEYIRRDNMVGKRGMVPEKQARIDQYMREKEENTRFIENLQRKIEKRKLNTQSGATVESRRLTQEDIDMNRTVRVNTQSEADYVDSVIDKADTMTDEELASGATQIMDALVAPNLTPKRARELKYQALGISLAAAKREMKMRVNTDAATEPYRVSQFIRNIFGKDMVNLSGEAFRQYALNYRDQEFFIDYLRASHNKDWEQSEKIYNNTIMREGLLNRLDDVEDVLSPAEEMALLRHADYLNRSVHIEDNDAGVALVARLQRRYTAMGQAISALGKAYNELFPGRTIMRAFQQDAERGNQKTLDKDAAGGKKVVDGFVKDARVGAAERLKRNATGGTREPRPLTPERAERVAKRRMEKQQQAAKRAWERFEKMTLDQIERTYKDAEKKRLVDERNSTLDEERQKKWTKAEIDKLNKQVDESWDKNSTRIINETKAQEQAEFMKNWRATRKVERADARDQLKTWNDLSEGERLEEILYDLSNQAKTIEEDVLRKYPGITDEDMLNRRILIEKFKKNKVDIVSELTRWAQDNLSDIFPDRLDYSDPYMKLGYIIRNREAFKDVWDSARAKMQKRLMLNDAEYERLLGFMERELAPEYRTKRVDALVKRVESEAGVTLEELVKDWAEEGDTAKQTFIERILEKTLLTGDDAAYLQRALEESMTRIVNERADAFVKSALAVKKGARQRTVVDKLLKVTRFGALENEAYRKLFSAKLGIPTLTQEQAALIDDTMRQIARMDQDKDWRRIDHMMTDMFEQLSATIPASMMDKAIAWKRAMMLLSPRSWIKNYTGNMGLFYAENVVNLMDAASERMFLSKDKWTTTTKRGVLLRGPRLGKNWGSVSYTSKVDPVRQMQMDTQYDRYAKHEIMNKAKYEIKSRLGVRRRIFKSDVMHETFKVPFDMLERGDAPFTEYWYKFALDGFMDARGLDTITPEAHEFAVNKALEMTFRQANRLSEAINNLKGVNKIFGYAVDGVIPFVNTGMNIAKTGMEFSPIGLVAEAIRAGVNKKQGKAVITPDSIHKMNRAVLGTAVYGLGYLLSSLGYLTGATPSDPDEKAKWRALGIPEYSIRIGGKWFSYDWMAPMAIPLMLGASVSENQNGGDIFAQVVGGSRTLVDVFVAQTVYRDIQKVIGGTNTSFFDTVTEDIAQKILFQNLSSVAFAPVNALSEYQYATYSPTTAGQILKQFELRYFSPRKLTGEMPIKYDVFGDPVRKEQLITPKGKVLNYTSQLAAALFAPFLVRKVYSTPKAMLVSDVFDAAFAQNPSHAADILPTDFKGTITDRGETYTLSEEEYATYIQVRGQYYSQKIEEYMRDPEFMRLPDYSATETSKFDKLARLRDRASEYAARQFIRSKG